MQHYKLYIIPRCCLNIDLICLVGGSRSYQKLPGILTPNCRHEVRWRDALHIHGRDSGYRYISCQFAGKGWWNIKSNVVFVETTEFLLQSSMTWFEVLMLDRSCTDCTVLPSHSHHICFGLCCNMNQIILTWIQAWVKLCRLWFKPLFMDEQRNGAKRETNKCVSLLGKCHLTWP